MPMHSLTTKQRGAIANALYAAATRWSEWSETLANPDVAATFADQAQEARLFAELFSEAHSARVGIRRDGRVSDD